MIRKLWLATLLSFIFSAILFAAIFFISAKKKSKNGLKSKEKEDAKNMFLSIASNEKYMDFFMKLAKLKHENVTKHKSYLVISFNEKDLAENNKKENKQSCSQSNIQKSKQEIENKGKQITNLSSNKDNQKTNFVQVKTLLYVDTSFSPLDANRFMEIYSKIKKENANKIVIVCKSVDKSLPLFVSGFEEKLIFLDEYQTYQQLYKLYNFFPEITMKMQPQKKPTFKDFVAYSFNRERTKGYLISSIILVISGIFIRPTIYYCIMASLLVCFAVFSQFNPTFNSQQKENIL